MKTDRHALCSAHNYTNTLVNDLPNTNKTAMKRKGKIVLRVGDEVVL
jgi:hypothetical protein